MIDHPAVVPDWFSVAYHQARTTGLGLFWQAVRRQLQWPSPEDRLAEQLRTEALEAMAITRIAADEHTVALARKILATFKCTDPANGVPGIEHCAACCGGSLLVVTCQEEQDVVDLCNNLIRERG